MQHRGSSTRPEAAEEDSQNLLSTYYIRVQGTVLTFYMYACIYITHTYTCSFNSHDNPFG